MDLSLVYEASFLLMDEFYGVFDSQNVISTSFIDQIDHGCECGRFAGTGGAGDKAESGAFEDAVAESARGVWIDAKGFKFRDVVAEDATGDAESGGTEVGLDAQAA